ncbi:MAG: phosphatidylserine decarboxylase [Deltaproteobacteria bacterium]|nr:phosphatidylserine decarboxylase [Deltaproteobacteria bacterium]
MTEQSETIQEFVAELKEWYKNDTGDFKTNFDAAVAGVKDPPADTDWLVYYDWKGKGIDDLCSFFIEWYDWMPKVETGLAYIQKFSWLYYENDAGQTFIKSDQAKTMMLQYVTLRGNYLDSDDSHPLVAEWIDELGDKQMSQFQKTKADQFKNFNDFFIRELKDGERPVAFPDDSTVVTAPADCIINMIVDDLTEETTIQAKNVSLNLNQLLNGSEHAKKFIGGTAVSCILMPNTYHWYHSPVSGKVIESNADVLGDYFGIKDFPDLLDKGDVGYGYDYSDFEVFRRGYLIIQTPNYGLVGMVPVGLNTVGSVVFKDPFKRITPNDTPAPITKGQQVGYFKYGGSLNILLFESGRFPSLNLLVGEKIGAINTNCEVAAATKWVDSGININTGDAVELRYSGGIWLASPESGYVDAAGNADFTAKPGYTLPGKNEGALCGRIGTDGNVFLVGKKINFTADTSGKLYFCINDDLNGEYGAGFTDNIGSVYVTVDITPVK